MNRLSSSRPAPARQPDGSPLVRSPLVLGTVGAAQAATGSLLCVLLPVVGVWMASPTTSAPWPEALRIGADAWLLAHHTSIATSAGYTALVPLGLTLLLVAWCWSSGRRMGEALRAVAGIRLRRQGIRAWCAFTCAYAVLATLVSIVAAAPVARPVSAQALLGAAALSGLSGGVAMLRSVQATGRTPRGAAGAAADFLRLPVSCRRVIGAATVAVAAWLACAGALALAAGLVAWDRVQAIQQALEPGPVGLVGLTVVQLAYVPTLVLWAAAWLAGPGFAVGAGTAVTPAAVHLGPLPAFPLLGVLPEPGVLPGWMGLAVAVPVLAGVLAGWWLCRSWARPGSPGRFIELGSAVGVGVVAGAVAALLMVLASGPAGPGRMTTMGPSPLMVGLVLAGEVAAGCLIAVVLFSARPLTAAQARAQLSRLGRRVRSSRRSS